MRPLKVIATALALSLLAAPALAEARPAKPPAAAKAGKKSDKDKGDKREERVLQALKREGIDEARAKRVIEVFKKYRKERMPVQQEMKKQREALRALTQSGSTDEAAYTAAIDGIEAQRKKLAEIQERQVKEVRGILKPSEQAKVLKLMHKGKRSGNHGKSAGAKKGSHAEA